MFYKVAVWLSCRLLPLGDATLLEEIKDYTNIMRCGIVALVVVVIPEKLPGTEDGMMSMGRCEILPHLCPLQAEMVVVGSQQGFLVGYRYDNHGTGAGCQGPSICEAILSDHPQQCAILMRCGLPSIPDGLAWYQSSSGSIPPEDAVDGSTSQTHETSNITLLHALTGKCKHFMPNTYGDGRGIRTISET